MKHLFVCILQTWSLYTVENERQKTLIQVKQINFKEARSTADTNFILDIVNGRKMQITEKKQRPYSV